MPASLLYNARMDQAYPSSNQPTSVSSPVDTIDEGHFIPAVISGTEIAYDALLEPAEDEEARLLSIFMEIVETALLAVAIWLVVNFATARYVVEGISMEPNFSTGQFLIVDKLTYRFFSEPQRGDIIVFDYPGNTSDDYVKRIVGLPGETIRIENGLVYVDGVLISEPYLDVITPGFYEETIPPNSYWVMGDNRTSSSDSRSWGVLEQSFIIGRAWVTYWPPEQWGVIQHFDEYLATP